MHTDPVTGVRLTEDQYKTVQSCRHCILNARTAAAMAWTDQKRLRLEKVAAANREDIERITGRPEPTFYDGDYLKSLLSS